MGEERGEWMRGLSLGFTGVVLDGVSLFWWCGWCRWGVGRGLDQDLEGVGVVFNLCEL